MRVTFLYRCALAVSAAVLLLSPRDVCAQLPSFNGAEGYGGTFSGGANFSGASIYHVTTTADAFDGAGKPVQGTLRGAFYDYSTSSPKQQASNRIVVFDVGGTFNISSAKLDIKTVNNIYIAGQTAPSPVTVYGNMAQITKSGNTQTSNVVMRYMTFRKGTGPEEDAISFVGGDGVASGDSIAHNMILDHVTASWSEDENISVTNNNTDVTVQYSLIHDALVNNHAYGSLIRPKVDSNVTFHHNLYANNASRQARFGSYWQETLTADFRNNVVYNYRDRASYAGGSSQNATDEIQEFADVDYVGNYIIAGPGTGSVPANFAGPGIAFTVDKNVTARVHQFGNLIDADGPASPASADGSGKYNGAASGWGMFTLGTVTDQSLTHMDTTKLTTSAVTTQSAEAAYQQVLNYAGNYWWNRDAIDTRVINNVRDYTGPSLAASAPIAAELNGLLAAPTTSRSVGWDTDGDGMPNNWETAHGLNPNSIADLALDGDGDGYVNLQEYLDEVGAFPAPSMVAYVGPASGSTARYALIANWKTNDLVEVVASPNPPIVHAGSKWQPSRFDEVQISGSTVTVDATGQHAGVLRVGGAPANNPTLTVASGWLKVENDLVVGGFGVIGALNLTGGTLWAKNIAMPSGSFNFTGGKLSADTVNFSLTNNGGTLAPGDSIGDTQSNVAPTNIGQTHVVGDLTLASGTLQIELASLGSFDKLVVDGAAMLGGNLAVSTLGGFTPTNGSSWQIISAGGLAGSFGAVTPGYTVQQQGNNLMLFFGTPTLAGDYNGDGIVSAGDYVTWRRTMDAGGTLLNETASLGVIDQADFDAWRANFGASNGAGSGASATTAAVPEPSAAMLLAMAFASVCCSQNRRVSRN